jgi:hypothetical protein
MSYRKLTEGKRFLPLAVPPVSRQVVFVVALVIDVTVAAVGGRTATSWRSLIWAPPFLLTPLCSQWVIVTLNYSARFCGMDRIAQLRILLLHVRFLFLCKLSWCGGRREEPCGWAGGLVRGQDHLRFSKQMGDWYNGYLQLQGSTKNTSSRSGILAPIGKRKITLSFQIRTWN